MVASGGASWRLLGVFVGTLWWDCGGIMGEFHGGIVVAPCWHCGDILVTPWWDHGCILVASWGVPWWHLGGFHGEIVVASWGLHGDILVAS